MLLKRKIQHRQSKLISMKKIFLLILFFCFNYLIAQNNPLENNLTSKDRIIENFYIKDSINVYYNKNKIPRPLIKALKNKFDGNFNIVNPGKKYRKTDVVRNIFLPNNQLIFLLKRDNYYGLVFKQGGRALITYFVFAEIIYKNVNELQFYTVSSKITNVNEFFEELKSGKFYPSNWLNFK